MAVLKISESKTYLPNVIRITLPKGKTKTVKINK